MKLTYLLVNFFSVIVPFLFSFHPKIKFNSHFIAFLKANAIAAFVFLIWDEWFTSIGVWSFNPTYVLGVDIFHLPLEEILFFICIPFSCVFSYHCSQLFFKINWSNSFQNFLLITLSILLLGLGIVFHNKAYTAFSFISTALIILSLKFYFKVNWLPQFLSTYPALLIPFFIVNGILTGTGLEQPVVMYNDAENLGIRILTIPIEDFVYGLELLLLNIFLFELFKKKSDHTVSSLSV